MPIKPEEFIGQYIKNGNLELAMAPILEIKSWHDVKETYLEQPDKMRVMLAYRKHFVDTTIRTLNLAHARGAALVKSVGSTDLTSDYDITIGLPGANASGMELDVIEIFNDYIKTNFGAQPGTIFDTNLYAKDFLPVSVTDQRLEIPELGAEMYNALVEGQDIGALVKQRRYTSYGDWLSYLEGLANDMSTIDATAADSRRTARYRYESADAQFLLYCKDILDEFQSLAGSSAKHRDAWNAMSQAAQPKQSTPSTTTWTALLEEQLALAFKVDYLQTLDADLVLEVCNKLYTRAMRRLRAYQRAANTAGSTMAHSTRAADLISAAIFFAAEAYHSEGALRHVVDGVQAVNANTTMTTVQRDQAVRDALARLTIEQLLQSINEQFGDFLKDGRHYRDSLEFLFRSSKYVQRLLEGTRLLLDKKVNGSDGEKRALEKLDGSSIQKVLGTSRTVDEILARLNLPEEGLLAVRKGKKKFSSNGERDTYVKAEAKTYFGVDTSAQLKTKITDMVRALNARVRVRLNTNPTATDVNSYFSALTVAANVG